MDSAFFVLYLIFIVWGLGCLICVASIISHIVRRHVLWDRQQDLVSKINWNIMQHADETATEAMKFEERNVFKSMSHHKHMILMNIVNIVMLIVIVAIVVLVFLKTFI